MSLVIREGDGEAVRDPVGAARLGKEREEEAEVRGLGAVCEGVRAVLIGKRGHPIIRKIGLGHERCPLLAVAVIVRDLAVGRGPDGIGRAFRLEDNLAPDQVRETYPGRRVLHVGYAPGPRQDIDVRRRGNRVHADDAADRIEIYRCPGQDHDIARKDVVLIICLDQTQRSDRPALVEDEPSVGDAWSVVDGKGDGLGDGPLMRRSGPEEQAPMVGAAQPVHREGESVPGDGVSVPQFDDIASRPVSDNGTEDEPPFVARVVQMVEFLDRKMRQASLGEIFVVEFGLVGIHPDDRCLVALEIDDEGHPLDLLLAG